jgi:hypothetical protein
MKSLVYSVALLSRRSVVRFHLSALGFVESFPRSFPRFPLPWMLAVLCCAGCHGAPSVAPMDAGSDAAEFDGGVVPTCPPVLVCDHVTASESPSDTPEGHAILRFEATDARPAACSTPWTLLRCDRTETFSSASAGTSTTTEDGCEEIVVIGNALVRCAERTTYTVNGELRWERTTTWETLAR